MRIKRLLFILIGINLFYSCAEKSLIIKKPHLIPAPSNLEVKSGQFTLNKNTTINYDDDFAASAKFLRTYLSKSFPLKINNEFTSNVISFNKDSLISNVEGYKIEITPKLITVHASSDRGAFYAVQTIRQLLPAKLENGSFQDKQIILPCLNIEDEPQFEYRGMHLDVARHMYSVDFIKKYIDALALLKMNTFHWHLTDDQGWRIEIKKYPELNTIGSYRKETLIGHYNDQPHQFDGKRYGGFYTQDQIKEIVQYALDRKITIIPEIEMPGHSQAVIATYPKLGCDIKPVEVATKWGVFEEIFCTKEATFTFLEEVLDEVIQLFPSEYIHIGGDEAPKTRWKTCPDCQRRMKQEGLKNEQELQSYFITRIEKYLNDKGRQIIGWDEILEGGLAPNATVMSWRGTEGAITAAKEKHNVIMTPTSHCYFDYYQSDNENEPLSIGGFLPLEKVYHFNPLPDELSKQEKQYIIGAQGNVWSEYMPTESQVEYMAFPRLLAMSEVVWSKEESKDYNDFISRLEHFNERLKILEIKFANHLYEVEGEMVARDNKLNYSLKTLTENKIIRFSLDGREPTINSEIYGHPIPITEKTTIKAAVFDTKSQLGQTFSETINFHKAVGKKVSLNVAPHKAYSGSGKEGLVNGIAGSDTRYGDKEWLGFWGDDLEIEIDLDEITKINSISTRFYNANGQWIYSPQQVIVKFSEDSSIKEKMHSGLVENRDSLISNFNIKFEDLSASKLILTIPGFGMIPEGKQGAGNKSWTFIDEIVIE